MRSILIFIIFILCCSFATAVYEPLKPLHNYTFDNNVLDTGQYAEDMTNSGCVFPTAINGQSINCTKLESDYAYTDASFQNISDVRVIDFSLKFHTPVSYQYAWGFDDGTSDNYLWFRQGESSENITAALKIGASSKFTINCPVKGLHTDWQHFTLMFGNGASLFINGTNHSLCSHDASNTISFDQPFKVGFWKDTYGNANIDHILMYPSSMSATEILDLHNTLYPVSEEVVTTTLLKPNDNNRTKKTIINFTYNVISGNGDLVNSSLIINGTRNVSGVPTNNTNNSFSDISTLFEGTWTWNVEVCAVGSCDNGTQRTLIIDQSPPNITNVTLISSNPDQTQEPFTSTDTTPTFNFTTKETAECFISELNGSWNGCTTTNLTGEHICTQPNELSEGTDYVYLNCTDLADNSAYRELEMLITAKIVFELDGLNESRKYEFGTIANLTASSNDSVCFDVYDDTRRFLNYSCGTSPFFYRINRTIVNSFREGAKIRNTTLINITKNSTNISIDNRTDLVLLQFNLSGRNVSGYPEDFDIVLNNTIKASIPGKMVGKFNEVYKFIYNTIDYTAVNLTYSTSGEKFIYINISKAGNALSSGILNFTITSFDLDAGNKFDYNQNFSNMTDGGEPKNITVDMVSTFDDFATNTSLGKWKMDDLDIGSKDYDASKTGINKSTCTSKYGFNGGKRCLTQSVVGDKKANVYPDFDLRHINQINTMVYLVTGGGTNMQIKLGFFGEDNEEFVLFEDIEITPSGDSSIEDWRNYTIWWTDPNTISVYYRGIHADGELEEQTTTHSIGTLEGAIRLVFWNQASNVATSGIQIHAFNVSGLGLNRTFGKYAILKTNWTKQLYDAPNNIIRARLTAEEPNTKGNLTATTGVQYLLSNDNGTTWETVVNNTFNTFDSTGNVLEVRVKLNSSNKLVSPIVSNLRVEIEPTAGNDLQIDIGDNGLIDMNLNYPLNGTTTPANYTGNDTSILTYDCSSNFTCLIPIKLTVNQTGMIQISDMNYTKNLNPINITDLSDVEKDNNISLLIELRQGRLNLSNLALDFWGSRNISIMAFQQRNRSVNITHTLQIRYSQFNLTFPSTQLFWEIFPNKRNQSDIEPYGQNGTDGIWEVRSSAYDDPLSVFVRYNDTIDSCVTNMTFAGMNQTLYPIRNQTLNVSLRNSTQELITGMNLTNVADIFTYTTINCSGTTDPFYIPYFCFRVKCQDCVETYRFDDECNYLE